MSRNHQSGGGPQNGGFILIFTILMLLGISALAVGMVYNAHHGEVAALNYKNRVKAFFASDGMRSLLAQEIIDGQAKTYLDTTNTGLIGGDVWDGLPGATVADLKAAMGGPPSRTVQSTYLGSNWKFAPDYGVRWKGYLLPPVSGPYTFRLRCDDACEFYVSTDDSPGNLGMTPLAQVDYANGSWPYSGPGVSHPVVLKLGLRYYFEFYHKQSGSMGVGQVGWSGPNYLNERPIPGKRLAPFAEQKQKWDTTAVGGRKVKYALIEAGPLVYTLNTEAITGGLGDTTYRSPLEQTLNMRGDTKAPPESLWQRVIYYDMHSNRSNPEFERGDPDFYNGLATKDMVRMKGLQYTNENANFFNLDSIGKPMVGNTPKWNCGVTRWFTPWKPGWFNTYAYAGGQTDCAITPTPGSDTAFKNFVIKDSLLFHRCDTCGQNVYTFHDDGPDTIGMNFDPLHGRGFGNDIGWGDHNWSFCMEMHTQFEHTSGMTFEFDGDDDVWLYIADSLVMDLGFVHPHKYEYINLDDLPLKFGETYPLDFFYCERQSAGSSIKITTNLPVLQVADKPRSNWKRDYGNLD